MLPLFMRTEFMGAMAHGSWELWTSAPTRNRVRLCYGERKGAGLTCGPGRSAAEEACAGVARGWRQRSWAGGSSAGPRVSPGRKGKQRPGKKMGRAERNGAGQKQRKEKEFVLFFFLISFQSNFEDKIQIKFKFEFKSTHSKNLYAAA